MKFEGNRINFGPPPTKRTPPRDPACWPLVTLRLFASGLLELNARCVAAHLETCQTCRADVLD